MTVDKNSLGLVHIYTGDGEGKTSASMGKIIRALGRGLKVKIIQLFKRDTGEQFFFENSGINYVQFKPLHPYFKNYDENELENLKEEFLKFWKDSVSDINDYDVLLIDELSSGINWNIISEELIINFIDGKPKNTELILTGRDFPDSIAEKADYVIEIKNAKHPFDKGVPAREGIEY